MALRLPSPMLARSGAIPTSDYSFEVLPTRRPCMAEDEEQGVLAIQRGAGFIASLPTTPRERLPGSSRLTALSSRIDWAFITT